MTATFNFDQPSRQRSLINSLSWDESEYVARFRKKANAIDQHHDTNSIDLNMSKSPSSDSNYTAPTVMMSDLSLVDVMNKSPSLTGSLSSSSGSISSSLSGNFLANAIESARTSLAEYVVNPDNVEQASVETQINKRPYVVQEAKDSSASSPDPGMNLEPYVQPQQQQHQQQQPLRKPSKTQNGRKTQRIGNKQRPQDKTKFKKKTGHKSKVTKSKTVARRTPKVTSASIPFENTIPPTSFLRDELGKDPAYQHALKAGTLWQSLVGQHVKFPALWFDGSEPARPYLGCEDPLKRNKWSYFGRHRVAGDPKLNALVRHGNSSGKLLLHIVCRDSHTLAPTEDIVVGVFHPNAENANTGRLLRHEDCRDVWIGHRSRSVPHGGRRIATRIESLLRYLHKNKVDKSPLGGDGDSKRSVDNTNMAMVFGSRPPRHTIFVPEEDLYELLEPPPQQQIAPVPPASVVLLRTFLR